MCTIGRICNRARVALLWQHNANTSSKLASIPRCDDIVRTAGWAGSARVARRRRSSSAGDRRAPPKPRAAYGKRARPARRRLAADGGRSQHYCGSLECGLSTGGVLTTKSERKMLASSEYMLVLALCLVLLLRLSTTSIKDLITPMSRHLTV